MRAVVKLSIKGSSPLLMNRFPLVPQEALGKHPPADQAEIAAYREPDTKELFVPGINFQRALVNAAAYSKGKGRASLQKVAAACLLVTPERVLLGTRNFEVDSRAVVVPATKGRIVRHRPRFDSWKLAFEIEYDDDLLSAKEVRRIVDDCGLRVGIGDFRPAKGGSFGRFSVVSWD